MAVRIFDQERIEELNSLKLVVTVYPTEDDWIVHWYFDNKDTDDEGQVNLQELYALVSSLSGVEDSLERLFAMLHNQSIGKDDVTLYNEDDDDE